MATQSRTTRLKLHDNDWKTLGVSRLTPDAVTCAEGLAEGADFEIDRQRGLVRRLREFGRELYTFVMLYDDRSEAAADRLVAQASDKKEAKTAISDLQAYIDLETPTEAQRTAATRLLANVSISLLRRALKD